MLPGSSPLTADSPLGRPSTAYALSKARSEQVARDLQAQAKPVTIVQPGMVWGPEDPALGEVVCAHLARTHPTVEVVRYAGGAGAVPLLVGVE